MKDNDRAKYITTTAMLSAVAYLVMLLGHFIPIVPIAALPFLRYDPKDIIIAVGGFLYGPVTAVLVSVVVSLIELVTVSSTGVIGFVMNMLATCSFCLPAAIVYAKKRTMAGAVIGLVSGTLMMTAMMLLWNYLITPMYMSVSREVIASMLLDVFLPFNLIKGGLNVAGTLMLYRPISIALRRANLAPASPVAASKGKAAVTMTLVVLAAALALVAMCVFAILI
jgi:riboflavin transporter FmnP